MNRFTLEARAALQQAGLVHGLEKPDRESGAGRGPAPQNGVSVPAFSRRDFLKSSGALIVGFSILGNRNARAQFGPAAAGSPPAGQVDSWIAIGSDGRVIAYTGKEELGQGIVTAQTQLVAEELSVPFEHVTLIYCDTSMTPDQGVTSGSQSHPSNFNRANLAQAGATAREALFQMASQKLGVPADRLTAWDGVISVKNDGAKKVTYAELLGGKKFAMAVNPNAKRKPVKEWKVLGTSVKRQDFPEVMTGRFEYVHNVRLPGMLHGRVVRPPAVGARVMSVDESSVKDIPGVKVVVKKDFVGVVAEKQMYAAEAAAKLKVDWSAGTGLPKQSEIYDWLKKQPSRDALMVDSKDTEQALASGATVVKATYRHPYQKHAGLGASCAVADVQGDKAVIYSPTQGVWHQRNCSAMILGLKPENVRVIFRRGSGCYGLNGADAVTFDAALLSQAVGKPVRVQLTRKDEMAWENFGFAFVLEQRAALDARGNIVAWEHESWSPNRGGRPGLGNPGNVVTGNLVGFEPQPFQPAPAAQPQRYNNNLNGIPSYVAGRVAAKDQGTGTVKSEKVLTHVVASPFWTGPLRSPSRLQNTFAHESFMDELAAKVKADPVEYRLRHLRDERVIDVLKGATKLANWEARPSPKPGNKRTGVVTGRGVACVAYEGDNGYTGIVVEADVNQDTGKVSVRRIWVAIDAGPISNPDGLRNQAEGGALQGMSRALGEEVTWDNEKVTSIDWRTFHSLPLGFDIPKMESVLIDRPDEEATGAGETAITVMAAAIGNAIFDATGVRIREIPLNPERVKAALRARG
ncbi:MAG TPA: molybdopterin cofactor-binding domain-containing protein [Bryobacteraceae bacterium]|nr:molybdopterin cofactor-binding domain-containing protein [Bryobacteraceae bacterium]